VLSCGDKAAALRSLSDSQTDSQSGNSTGYYCPSGHSHGAAALHYGRSTWTISRVNRWRDGSPITYGSRGRPRCLGPRAVLPVLRVAVFPLVLLDVPQAPWLRKPRGVRDGRRRLATGRSWRGRSM